MVTVDIVNRAITEAGSAEVIIAITVRLLRGMVATDIGSMDITGVGSAGAAIMGRSLLATTVMADIVIMVNTGKDVATEIDLRQPVVVQANRGAVMANGVDSHLQPLALGLA